MIAQWTLTVDYVEGQEWEVGIDALPEIGGWAGPYLAPLLRDAGKYLEHRVIELRDES